MPWLSHVNLKAETQDVTNCYDTSPQQVTAMNHLVWHVKIIVSATEFCHCNLLVEFKPVWIRVTYRSDKISTSSFVAACVHICDKSLWPNLNQPMREHQLLSHNVNFELVYISSLPKSIACTEQVSHCSDLLQQLCRQSDLSQRCVASCVSALKHCVISTTQVCSSEQQSFLHQSHHREQCGQLLCTENWKFAKCHLLIV